MITVLSVAGFDPSSGAGITADLMVFAAHGLNGVAAITALTVQSTRGVREVHPTDAGVLEAMLQCVDEDMPPAGIKVGMLGSAKAGRVVAEYLECVGRRGEDDRPIVVVDPVLRSSSGKELVDARGLAVLRERILPAANWVTPNVPELELLTDRQISRREDLPEAALALRSALGGGVGVLAKGGHMETPDDLVLPPHGEPVWLPGERAETRATHGTGCALSSAFLSRLVLGEGAVEAARGAKEYVRRAMVDAALTGSGACRMNHLWTVVKAKQE